MIPAWWADPLTRAGVKVVQRKLGLPQTGEVDRATEMAVRGFQHARGLEPTGTVCQYTAEALGETWYGLDDLVGMTPDDVLARFGMDTDALKRYQGTCGLQPTGVVDHDTAMILARLDG